MKYGLIKEVITLIEEFDLTAAGLYTKDLNGFKQWISDGETGSGASQREPTWEGKENGRSPESVISTLLVHMNRYAKTYSKSAICDSDFSTQEDFIYLITLKSFGDMTKMELIKRNIQDKPTGMLIINRLIKKGWIFQGASETDKRSRVLSITDRGVNALGNQMDKIRLASKIVAGNLSYKEKMDLIVLLKKLNDFHQPIFLNNIDTEDLLAQVVENYLPSKN